MSEISSEGYARSGDGEEWSTVDLVFWDDMPDVDEEQIARMFYRMEGWEKYWPYEERPEWLRGLKYP